MNIEEDELHQLTEHISLLLQENTDLKELLKQSKFEIYQKTATINQLLAASDADEEETYNLKIVNDNLMDKVHFLETELKFVKSSYIHT